MLSPVYSVFIVLFLLSRVSAGFVATGSNKNSNTPVLKRHQTKGQEEEFDISLSIAADTNRRSALQTFAFFPLVTLPTASTSGASAEPVDSVGSDADPIRVPLEYIPALSAYVVHFFLFGERFGAIVDTGSPFLTAPATCSTWSYKYKWGCYHPELTFDSGYKNTLEIFDNNQGTVVWRKAPFTFGVDNLQPRNLTFGVFGPDLLDGSGWSYRLAEMHLPRFARREARVLDIRRFRNIKIFLGQQTARGETKDGINE